MKQADLIWMNGEFVAWEDAKVHVLTHGLHYGTGVFEGIRCYDTESSARPSSATASTCSACARSAELYYMPLPYDVEALRTATHELIGRNGLRSCYIRPLVLPRLRPDGPQPARRAGRRDDRRLGVGRLPRRGGQAEGHPHEGLELAADQPRAR